MERREQPLGVGRSLLVAAQRLPWGPPSDYTDSVERPGSEGPDSEDSGSHAEQPGSRAVAARIRHSGEGARAPA